MFFLVDIKSRIKVEPIYFNQNFDNVIKEKLVSKIEGKMDSVYGFVIKIIKIKKISSPVVSNVDGSALYDIELRVMTFHPLRGQVIDGIVTKMNIQGIYVNIGPISVYISKRCMPKGLNFEYDSYKSENVEIEKGDKIRLKILGIRKEETKFNGIGIINRDFLGLL